MSGHKRLYHSLRLSIRLFSEYSGIKPYHVAPASLPPASAAGDLSTSSTPPSIPSSGHSDWRICSVLCLYDYVSDDPTHLSFSTSEILEIVQQEESGWWAALRLPENHIGWISSAFVQPISEELAERLKRVPQSLRLLEYDAGQKIAPNSAYITEYVCPMSSFSQVLWSQGDWLPNIEKIPTTPAVQKRFTLIEEDAPNDNAGHLSPAYIPSVHSSPTRINVPAPDSGLDPTENAQRQSWYLSQMSPLQQLRNRSFGKPISPTPPSFPYTAPASPHTRSQSDSGPHRYRRRRPLLLDDSSSLSRLSTLIQSQNIAEIDFLAHSPPESMDAFSRLASGSPLGTGGIEPLLLTRGGSLPGGASPIRAQSYSPRPMSAWFMRPSYNEDNIDLDYDGKVKAATLQALIERLTLDYLKSSEENRFRHTFLTTFRTFASADLVFDLITDQYGMAYPQDITPEELEEWKEKKLRTTQHRVLTILTMWMEDHNMAREEPRLARRLKEFLQSIHEPPSFALTAKLMLQALDRLTPTTPLPLTPITPAATPKRWRYRALATELVRMDVTELAQQLCLIAHRLYAKIRVRDCWIWNHTASALADFFSARDKLATWVKSSLLNVDGVRKKAELMDFWIHCAEKCTAMNNISSMDAIVTALTSNAVAPLNPTWSQIHRKASIDALVKLSSVTDNHIAYKTLLQSIDGPCVPFIDMYLAEIRRVNQEYPDMVPSNNDNLVPTPLINFTKRRKWAEIIEPMFRFQSRSYSFVEVPYTMSYIEGNLVTHDPEPPTRAKSLKIVR